MHRRKKTRLDGSSKKGTWKGWGTHEGRQMKGLGDERKKNRIPPLMSQGRTPLGKELRTPTELVTKTNTAATWKDWKRSDGRSMMKTNEVTETGNKCEGQTASPPETHDGRQVMCFWAPRDAVMWLARTRLFGDKGAQEEKSGAVWYHNRPQPSAVKAALQGNPQAGVEWDWIPTRKSLFMLPPAIKKFSLVKKMVPQVSKQFQPGFQRLQVFPRFSRFVRFRNSQKVSTFIGSQVRSVVFLNHLPKVPNTATWQIRFAK